MKNPALTAQDLYAEYEDLYREAELRIALAKRTGATELSLDIWDSVRPEKADYWGYAYKRPEDFGLRSLPKALWELTGLKKLDLSGNRLRVLPSEIGLLTALEELVVVNNQLETLPAEVGQLKMLTELILDVNQLTTLPEGLFQLSSLQHLGLDVNRLTSLPEAIDKLTNLHVLWLDNNRLTSLPEALGRLPNLQVLWLSNNQLTQLPDSLGQLKTLRELTLANNRLSSLPDSLQQLTSLQDLSLEGNPLPQELLESEKQGVDAVRAYLRAAKTALFEAKLILVGEGRVGKTSLLRALRGEPFDGDSDSTHGVEIWPVTAADPTTGEAIRLNAWDFGGQTVYRPTHQLFFSAPAVYVVVWKPSEGTQQGALRYWIRLIRLRAPAARILVVATHGGPNQRLPDINRQELWELFGRDTVVDFFQVDSDSGRGVEVLRTAIGQVAAGLPEMGRRVPTKWLAVREALRQRPEPYLPWAEVLAVGAAHGLEGPDAALFVAIEHELGNLIHFRQYEQVRDIVILKPDWLAKALSFVFESKAIRDNGGLAPFAQLRALWNNPERQPGERYPAEVHPLLVVLMEEYDISYRIADAGHRIETSTSLIGQLVPDLRPEERLAAEWSGYPSRVERRQVCQLLEVGSNQSAPAEGLFYRLIVRLNRYSLGRTRFAESVHWQRGLVLDAAYHGRALLEHVGDNIHITVRAVDPTSLLGILTEEVKAIVEERRSGWEGLRCVVTVPCVAPCGLHAPGKGLFALDRLYESLQEDRTAYPCPTCGKWAAIPALLQNVVVQTPAEKAADVVSVGEAKILRLILSQGGEQGRHFERIEEKLEEATGAISRIDASTAQLLRDNVDIGRFGPRLFDLQPVEPAWYEWPKSLLKQRFRLTLWCEYSRLPVPDLYEVAEGKPSTRGRYELELTRAEVARLLPYLSGMLTVLAAAVGVATTGSTVVGAMLPYLPGLSAWLTEARLAHLRETLVSSRKTVETLSRTVQDAGATDTPRPVQKLARDYERAGGDGAGPLGLNQGEVRVLHAYLKDKDVTFGGLRQMRNPGSEEMIWMHPHFARVFEGVT